MAEGFTLDDSDLRGLQGALGRAPSDVVPYAESVLKKSATVLKGGMQSAFRDSDYFQSAALVVSYDRIGFAREIAYEIGPEMRDGGALAHIAVDGGANGGGGSVDIDNLLADEAPVIEKFIGDVLEDLL
jgi:hypothetical protein